MFYVIVCFVVYCINTIGRLLKITRRRRKEHFYVNNGRI